MILEETLQWLDTNKHLSPTTGMPRSSHGRDDQATSPAVGRDKSAKTILIYSVFSHTRWLLHVNDVVVFGPEG